MPLKSNIAYIDSANLNSALQAANWKLDHKRFRVWLTEKFDIDEALLFLGFISKNADLYTFLQVSGFQLVFKEVIFKENGIAKGNCDANLILKAVTDYYEGRTETVLLASSDGDYAPLVKFFESKEIPIVILSPSPEDKCSILLKRTNAKIYYLEDQRGSLEYKKTPDTDGTV